MKCAQERGHRDETDIPLLSWSSWSGKEIHTEIISIECDIENGVTDDLPAEPQGGRTSERTRDLVLKGELDPSGPSCGKHVASRRHGRKRGRQ